MDTRSQSAEKITALCYIIGVYFGDGCCYKTTNYRKYFSLNACDEDFVRKTQSCFSKVFGKHGRFSNYIPTSNKRNSSKWRKVYSLHVMGDRVYRFFPRITKHRLYIPRMVRRYRSGLAEFVSGVMDSEGFISCLKRTDQGPNGRFRFMMGVGATQTWIDDFVEILKSCGVKVGKRSVERSNKYKNKVMIRYRIDIGTYIASGFYFSIDRKQKRLIDFKNMILSETKRTGYQNPRYSPNLLERVRQI